MANPNIVNVATINAGNAGWNLGTGLTDTLLTVGADVVVKINTIICILYKLFKIRSYNYK